MMKLTERKKQSGGLIATDVQDKLRKENTAAKRVEKLTSEYKMFYMAIGAMLLAIGCIFGWYRAEKRYAEEVRVVYVKMHPNGTTVVEFAEEEKPVHYFQSTVESKLQEFVEKRYSKQKDTISTDYGFAKLMMSPELQTDFMVNEDAPKVAAAHADCKECPQRKNIMRDIQMIDKDPLPGSKKRKQYNTLVFSTFQNRDATGRVISCENKIITLLWTFRTTEEIIKKRDELRYNPLGQEIIRSSIRDDPTVVPLPECKKLM
jgi:hypothetical protein